MVEQEQKFELIISTESKVLACNIADFEKRAEQFLSTLTQKFETDDDFAQAKKEVKILKELEDKTRVAIKKAQQGDINKLITQAESIAERFRQERLSREKLVKSKEQDVKQHIINAAIEEIMEIRQKSCSENAIAIALSESMPKNDINQRIQQSAKNPRTLDGLAKSVNAEKTLILAETAQEIGRLQSRLKLIPVAYCYLFNDSPKLIAGSDELQPIIDERIATEEKREAELKAKAELEAKAKAEAERVQAEAKVVADEMEAKSAVENPQETASPETGEPLADFVITVRLNQITQSQAIEIARSLKARFGDGVTLNKAK